jgi:large subunit ribosomal protein L2
MGIKHYRPTSPGRRLMTVADFAEITKSTPEKKLTKARQRLHAHNNSGCVTVRFRGGAHKRRYRFVDYKRDKVGVPAKVAAIEYDPNRSARLALLHYADGEKRYIVWPLGVAVGDVLITGPAADIRPGNALPLSAIPLGTQVHCVELKPGKGGQLARGAGAMAQLMAKEGDYAVLRVPSGEMRKVNVRCYATIGQVGNLEHENIRIGKAGRQRWLGRKPHSRGVAMNPVDHPMGGGEGRSSGGRHPCTPWGVPTKGHKTRKNPRTDNMIVRRRNKK